METRIIIADWKHKTSPGVLVDRFVTPALLSTKWLQGNLFSISPLIFRPQFRVNISLNLKLVGQQFQTKLSSGKGLPVFCFKSWGV